MEPITRFDLGDDGALRELVCGDGSEGFVQVWVENLSNGVDPLDLGRGQGSAKLSVDRLNSF